MHRHDAFDRMRFFWDEPPAEIEPLSALETF
jgi:hypothetical protein